MTQTNCTLEQLKEDATGRQVNVAGTLMTVVRRDHLPDRPLGLTCPGQSQERLDWSQTLALAALLYGDEATLTYQSGQTSDGPRFVTVPVQRDPLFTWAEDGQAPWQILPFPELPPHLRVNGEFRIAHAHRQGDYARAQLRTGLSPFFFCPVADLQPGDLMIDWHAQGERVTPLLDARHEPQERRVTLTTPDGETLTSHVQRARSEWGQWISYDQVRAPGEVLDGDEVTPAYRLIHRPAAGSTVTLAEWSTLQAMDPGQARRFALDGRLPGAYKSAGTWLLPRAAQVLPVPQGRPVVRTGHTSV